jgi:hypothetical protein
MISFNYETEFRLDEETKVSQWISNAILSENLKEGDIIPSEKSYMETFIFLLKELLITLKIIR